MVCSMIRMIYGTYLLAAGCKTIIINGTGEFPMAHWKYRMNSFHTEVPVITCFNHSQHKPCHIFLYKAK